MDRLSRSCRIRRRLLVGALVALFRLIQLRSEVAQRCSFGDYVHNLVREMRYISSFVKE